MKSRALAVLAALSILSAPVAVQAAKPAEVTLHIEATAQVAPDRAVVPYTITGRGKDEAQARADLRDKEGKFMAALADKGIDAAKVTTESAGAGQDPVKLMPVEEEAACAAADAAADAAMDAAPVRKKGRATAVAAYDCPAAYTKVSKALLITIDDPAKIDGLLPLTNDGGYPYGRLRPVFSQSDPVAARKKARTEALAKANAEADAYAEALGYRVVRPICSASLAIWKIVQPGCSPAGSARRSLNRSRSTM
jgi:uncharacterized protein YggE